MEWGTIAAIIGTITTACAAAGGWFSKQGVDAWKRIREEKRTDAKFEDDRQDHDDAKEERNLLQIINRQDGELLSLRTEIKEMRADHRAELKTVHEQRNKCQEQLAALQTELRIRMEVMATRVDKVEACQVATDLTVEKHHKESNNDSKVVVVVPKDIAVLPDGSEFDPNDPEDAKVLQAIKARREAKRLADERNRA